MTLVRSRKPWRLPESAVTPETTWLSRRQVVAGLGLAAVSPLLQGCYLSVEPDASVVRPRPESGFLADLYPAQRNLIYKADRALSTEVSATRFNNFYEFTSNKSEVWRLVDDFVVAPWSLEIAGLVQKPQTFDVEQLIRSLPLEERIYRFRCVEAWSMTVPWTGFPLARLLDRVQPLSTARYLRFFSAARPKQMPGLAASASLPWPYFEGLRLDEANHELAFLATGIYGKPLPAQNGAPLRLVVPWKYGYKSIKSIVKIELVASPPSSFWNKINPGEYDFDANVNPSVPHPRWSQETELPVDGGARVATLPYNGYGESIAKLYE